MKFNRIKNIRELTISVHRFQFLTWLIQSDFDLKAPKSKIFGSKSDFHKVISAFFCPLYFKKKWHFAPYTSRLSLFQGVLYLFGSFSFYCVIEFFENFTKDLSRQSAHRAQRIPKYNLVKFFVKNCWTLVRYCSDFRWNWSDSQVRF